MATDIFNYSRNVTPDIVFSSELTEMNWAGAGEGSLIQNWSIQYQQQVEELFELGGKRIYWVKGRPVGAGTIGRIAGGLGSIAPSGAMDICDGGVSMTIKARSGTCNGNVEGIDLTLSGVLVTGKTYNGNVQTQRIMEGVSIRFASLSE